MDKHYLVIGSGGREHALAWKLAQEPGARVYVAPGNAGMSADPAIAACIDVAIDDFDAMALRAHELEIDLTIVGPEGPLCAGIVDHFKAQGLAIFGPSKVCARLEASKHYAKQVMLEAGVATAQFEVFVDLDAAEKHLTNRPHPCVIKADGLAGGKGVVVSPDVQTSIDTVRAFMRDATYGAASETIVVEDCLEGPEVSFIAVCDGVSAFSFATSRDHKRLLDGDQGPNTGGMGAIVPSPHTSMRLEEELLETVIQPVLDLMAERGTPYVGFLYAGVMLTADGPKVLEFNVRLGDPETQALMFGMRSGLGARLESAAAGQALPLGSFLPTCCVVLASHGYPANPQTGVVIEGLDQEVDDTYVFHAGTRSQGGAFVTSGGRVLAVTGRGKTPEEARERAYTRASKIRFDGMLLRSDIGL